MKISIFQPATLQVSLSLRINFEKINPGIKPNYKFVDPFLYDVKKRIPSTEKAKRLLGFEAKTSLSEMLDIVIPWIRQAKEENLFN
ncbi:hypothetical protein CM15mP35_04540 [bacterium]|nr:MAG: hypothetical protein CM15mP35_04540 [bacterium]